MSTTSSSTPRFAVSAVCTRKLTKAAEKVLCQGCYSPITLGKKRLPAAHPCLFCTTCLGSVTARGTHKYNRPLLSKSESQQSDIAAWDNSAMNEGTRRFSCNEVLLNASLKSNSGTSFLNHVRRSDTASNNNNKEAQARQQQRFRKEEFADKLNDLETRATRCGFCHPWLKRRALVTFCVHCRKYICRQHTEVHKQDKYLRLHGTVNLTLVPNDALL